MDGAVLIIDFSKIGAIDYSCADEIVAKLISSLLGNKYGHNWRWNTTFPSKIVRLNLEK